MIEGAGGLWRCRSQRQSVQVVRGHVSSAPKLGPDGNCVQAGQD
jgi:hypothetical protein